MSVIPGPREVVRMQGNPVTSITNLVPPMGNEEVHCSVMCYANKISVSITSDNAQLGKEDIVSLLSLCNSNLLSIQSRLSGSRVCSTNTPTRTRKQLRHFTSHLLRRMLQIRLLMMQRERQVAIRVPHRRMLLHGFVHFLQNPVLQLRVLNIIIEVRRNQLLVDLVPLLQHRNPPSLQQRKSP